MLPAVKSSDLNALCMCRLRVGGAIHDVRDHDMRSPGYIDRVVQDLDLETHEKD